MGRLKGAGAAMMLLVAACGGDSAMSMEDYFTAVEAESTRYDETTGDIANALSTQFTTAIEDYSAAAADADEATAAAGLESLTTSIVAATTASYELTGVELDQFITAMDDLEPPDEVSAEHDEAVAALRTSRAAIGPTIVALDQITSLEELETVLAGSDFADSRARLEASCTALEQAGVDNGVEVDLDCRGDDQPQP